MTFEIPTKRIISSGQLEDFQSSQTHADIVTFIEQLNESVINVKLTDTVEATVRLPSLHPWGLAAEARQVEDQSYSQDLGAS